LWVNALFQFGTIACQTNMLHTSLGMNYGISLLVLGHLLLVLLDQLNLARGALPYNKTGQSYD
jgi:hypothetical protein